MRNVREPLILTGVICAMACSSTSINNNLIVDSAGGTAPLPSATGGASASSTASNTLTGGVAAIASGGSAASGGQGGAGPTSASGGLFSGGATGLTSSATGGLVTTLSVAGSSSTGGSSGFVTGGTPGIGGTSAPSTSLPVGGAVGDVGGAFSSIAVTGGTAATTGGMTSGGATTAAGGASVTTGGSAAGGGPATGGATGVTPILEKCTLLLHMDETSWSGSASEVVDSSGAANNGTACGASTAAAPSKFGRAGYFPGGGYVRMASSDTLHALNAFSIAAWIYPTGLIDDSGYSMGVVTKRSGYQDKTEFALFIWHDTSNVGQHLYVDVQGEESRCASTAQLVNERWYHVALVFDGSLPANERIRIYINGQLDSVHYEASSSVTQYDSPVEVGRLQNGGDTFIGTIDEVAMWQRPLSQLEVSSLYEATTALQ